MPASNIRPGLALVLFVAICARAQSAHPQDAIVVDVTGSNIPSTDLETALPVQRITRQDIERSGATSVVELLNGVSANLIGQNDAVSIGSNNPGSATADLRGLGSGSTLVLIDGRRVANYAFDGGAVDLNSIPLAAIDRVEILKDGASAIYGSDATAGVINFILRKDYTGVSATVYTGDTQHGGGDHQQATVTAGYGDLATDRYNAFVTLDVQKDQGQAATARAFSRTSYLPAEGVNHLSANTFPANVLSADTFFNPSRASGCAPPQSLPLGPTDNRCGFDYLSIIDVLPPVERDSLIAGATWRVDRDGQVFAHYLYSHSDLTLAIAPTPVSEQLTFNGTPVLYPAGGPFYPTAFANANGISGPLDLYYRTIPLGPRIDDVVVDSQQLTLGVKGRADDWNYDVAYVYSDNRERDSLQSGWVSQSALVAAMATGLINPFGPSGPVGDALLAGAQVTGTDRTASGTTHSVEAKLARDIAELPAGPLALAVGAELRRESFADNADAALAGGDVLSMAQAGSKRASRNVAALYAEFNIPVVKTVEAQVAARDDHYSDFGNTVNPKVALRWQPLKSLLLRGSWSTGFRAPSLYDLYTPLSQGTTADMFDDPLRCPTTQSMQDCGRQFRLLTGGNPDLKPEKSRQFNGGILVSPASGLSLGADYWNIVRTNTIGLLSSDAIFENFDRYASRYIVRGPVDPANPGLPGPIESVLGLATNLGELDASGLDVDVTYQALATPIGRFSFSLDGTYILVWKSQFDGVNTVSALGSNLDPRGVGAVPRWRHHAVLNWTRGILGVTLAEDFTLGYTDENPDLGGNPRRVGSYDLWNVQGTCACLRNTAIALGVKNVFDRAPPFSNQAEFTQIGYNPQYGDPRGRLFYASVTLAFN